MALIETIGWIAAGSVVLLVVIGICILIKSMFTDHR